MSFTNVADGVIPIAATKLNIATAVSQSFFIRQNLNVYKDATNMIATFSI